MTIWAATGNAHKIAELTAIFKDQGVDCTLLCPRDAGLDFNPDETEDSFHGNALLKARALYTLLNERRLQGAGSRVWNPGDPILADDSGICVDGLGGRPGIYSARYAGTQGATDAAVGKKLGASERNALLLAELGDNPVRSARFVCAMALFFSPDRFYIAQDSCEGELVKGPEYARGSGGFGYDPILFIPELQRTVAELPEDVKNRISHRAKAGKALAKWL